MGILLSWSWQYTCLLKGSSELMPCLALLAYVTFTFTIKPFLSQPMSFLALTLAVLSPILLSWSELLC